MSPSSETALTTTDLRRSFGQTVAVAGISLRVPIGSIFGLLGPDGAGKTTLLRMLATVLRPSSGTATVLGADVATQSGLVTHRIGYMSQRFSLYPDLSVAENLEFFARLRGVPKARRASLAPELLTAMGLEPFASRQARFLSGGMKQKLMLASTLMHDPDLLLLDEPTTGVDPVSRREFWRILAEINAGGTTVLVATPYMDEADRCTHIAFVDAGRVRASGTPAELKAAVSARLLEVHCADPRAALRTLQASPTLGSVHLLGDSVRVLADTAEPVAAVTALLGKAGIAADVTELAIDMESVYASLAAEEVVS